MLLRRLARSLPLTALALAAFANGCALPQVQPRVAKDFATGQTQVRSIAVLPVDLSVTVAANPADGRLLDARMVGRIQKGLEASLARRGYRTSLVEPNGAVRDPRRGGYQIVIHPRDLGALRVEIHNTTSAHAPGPGYLEARVSTELTRHLGKATGTDATLYARGYAYVGTEPSGGETAVKVIVGILLVVIIVGLVIALVGSKGKGGGGGGKAVGRALGGAGRAVGRAALTVGHVAIRTLPYVAHAAAHAHHRAHYRDVYCYTCPPPPPPPPPPAPPVPVGPEPVDEPMPAPTTGPHEAERAPAPPPALPAPPLAAPAPPRPEPPPTLVLRQGPPPSESTVGVQISLVQNASGRVLWHAGQAFAVRTQGEADVEELIEHFLRGLPPARR
jgi:hypothetical protein